MRRRNSKSSTPSVVRIVIHADHCTDEGVGIVVLGKPLTVLVPSHLVLLIEDGEATSIDVGGEIYERAEILSAPTLSGDQLSLLRFRGRYRRRHIPSRIPKHSVVLDAGQPLTLHLPSDSDPHAHRVGTVLAVRGAGDGASITTNIPVVKGESGSALCVSGQLAAVCQGMSVGDSGGTAIAVPLSTDALHMLRNLQRRRAVSTLSLLIGLTLALIMSFIGWFIWSWQAFIPSSYELHAEGAYMQVNNVKRFTVRPSWRRAFETEIYKAALVPTHTGKPPDLIAVGTKVHSGVSGAIILLDRLGRERWRYSVPDGECIYSIESKAFDKYLVGHISFGDLNRDGRNELVVAFMHEHDEPCKLMVFDLDGSILAEYWHPGYVRTTVIGPVGTQDSAPLLVVTASNNPLKTAWWNPQTLFAFRGLDISGQAPPYHDIGGVPVDYPPGTELWYRQIENPNGEEVRAKCYKLDIVDIDADGSTEIRATLTDGRFYYLDVDGNTVRVDEGDRWHQLFGDLEPPPLESVPLRR